VWETNFWNAFDSLSVDNVALVKDGLKLAKQSTEAISRAALHIVNNKLIKEMEEIRYCIYTPSDSASRALFTQPGHLGKLALFLSDVKVVCVYVVLPVSLYLRDRSNLVFAAASV
jgi:hypothetical protein